MRDTFCPYCGSSSRLLFNLVACITPACRNYEETWHREWAKNNRPNYHHYPWAEDEQFLGCFTSSRGTVFDLYQGRDPSGTLLAMARFGNDDNACYYVDENETEIGNTATGPVNSINRCVKEALKSALRRLRKGRTCGA